MIYPSFLKEQDTIGVSAPSNGINKKQDINRLNNAIKKFNEKNFLIKETKSVRSSTLGRSTSSKNRAKELEELYLNDKIKAIIIAAGGDFLLEMLSDFDFEVVKNNLKWLQGYSDPTALLYTITTKYDIATIYADNFKAFGMEPWHQSLLNNLEILKGSIKVQESFPFYEEDKKRLTGLEPYNLTKKVYWQNITSKSNIKIKGRIIGGCLDVLQDLFKTKYDNTKEFIEKYKDDGIIWFFDICELSSESIIRILWKMKDSNYFKYTKAILFSRIYLSKSYYDISYIEAIKTHLESLNIPIIINTDIGHIGPRLTIINGAVANISVTNGKGKIEFILK